ncbi:hypothetical protein [Serratia sp. 2723]|uniref:hypothetical protein n=1 Tax=unclassified Serratia (in: enterobacteria) TaxID=2647522 RepID=UPI003D1D5415
MADNIIGIYQRHAGAFEQKRSTTLFEQPWLERFLSLLPNNGRILDSCARTTEAVRGLFLNDQIPTQTICF